MRRYLLLVALLLVVVPLAVAVSEEVPNDRPAFCLLVNGVSWLPVDSLPEALRQHVTDETATRVINGVTFVPIKRFVEAQGGSVGWDGSAGLVMVEFEGQNIAFKALHSDSFWASPSVRTLRATLLSVSTDSKSEPSTESGTNPSEQWEPPRLVDGVWVTSGVSDEVAKQVAALCNEGKTRDEVRQIDWDVYWQWHWEEEGAPEWAMQRGEKEEVAQRAAQKVGHASSPHSGGSIIEVPFDIGVPLTDGTAKLGFLYYVRDVVPETLARVRNAAGVRVVGSGTFTTIRGHEYRGIAFDITFSRQNAATINWQNVSVHDLDDIADRFYQHPGVKAN